MFDALIAQAGGLNGPVLAFLQVLMIDLVLAGDNAVAVGLAAGGLPVKERRKVILYGLGAAVVLRIGFALITTWLLGVIGLLLAGGVLLLWVCWKMWRELREQATHDQADAMASIDGDPTTEPGPRPAKSFKQAFLQVLIADVSMSLDNVLAVAGAAREHPAILVFGLLLSIVLMGLAASAIANLLHKHRWIGFVGLAIVFYVATHMIWQGHRSVVMDLDKTAAYNAAVPSMIDIGPDELARHARHKN
ncbi:MULTISPECIES: TerC family protein [unclassified Caulobacter]|uniref:TerC family protein n=1 Tax=unclassified Caulobacter TaxID=2648921 RepID=UPI000D3853B2|nr:MULTISPECIES: TerC family protein [unclassified Caulobacter]PTS87408.1 tellurium resistance protein TerC [Caulobacter sp. HMWF009]PTT11671.1 tellurium resistance protein TerC [Caulobacter sp. HMWF025]